MTPVCSYGTFDAFERDICALANVQWDEVHPEDPGGFDLDAGFFLRLSVAGRLIAILVRDGERGPLCGYMLLSTGTDPVTRRVTMQDRGLYVSPAARSLKLLNEMLGMAEDAADRLGVQVLELSQPARGSGRRLGRLLERRGYGLARTTYARTGDAHVRRR